MTNALYEFVWNYGIMCNVTISWNPPPPMFALVTNFKTPSPLCGERNLWMAPKEQVLYCYEDKKLVLYCFQKKGSGALLFSEKGLWGYTKKTVAVMY